MIGRRHMIRVAAVALPLLVTGLMPSTTQAQQSFQRFFPLLVELPGWKAGKPDGAAVQVPGASMVSATREYQRGKARLDVQVIIGAVAQGAVAGIQPGIKVETGDGRVSTTTIDGLPVMQSFNLKDKSGAIVVALGPSAMFNLSFNGIEEDEALSVARKFDWKAMQAALPK